MLEHAEPAKLTRALAAITTATTTELVAASTGNQLRVWRIIITSATAQDLTIKSASTTLGVFQNVTSVCLAYNHFPWFTTTASEALNLTTAGAVDCNVVLDYTTLPINIRGGQTI